MSGSLDSVVMTKPSEYWSGAVSKYRTKDWSSKPSLFAQSIKKLLPQSGSLLELGSGVGNDGEYFYTLGYAVTQTDLRDFRGKGNKSSSFRKLDMSKPVVLHDTYDIIYAHLSLHYFTFARTETLFLELHNHLKKNGILAFLVNSTHDPEFGQGTKIEEHYYDFFGIAKRYFDQNDTKIFTTRLFKPLLLDDNGTSYKDSEDGMLRLVEFVGQKI